MECTHADRERKWLPTSFDFKFVEQKEIEKSILFLRFGIPLLLCRWITLGLFCITPLQKWPRKTLNLTGSVKKRKTYSFRRGHDARATGRLEVSQQFSTLWVVNSHMFPSLQRVIWLNITNQHKQLKSPNCTLNFSVFFVRLKKKMINSTDVIGFLLHLYRTFLTLIHHFIFSLFLMTSRENGEAYFRISKGSGSLIRCFGW